ncbi:MAG: hypothetical protein J6Y47_06185 [Bacteroidales bacterium]|nr:hypothetical protein [Bacteroidales bacterium]
MREIKSILFLIFVVCAVPTVSVAQKSDATLVTDAMARKVAYAAKYGNNSIRSHMFNDFCNGNNIHYSTYEYDKLLENIVYNKDKVENFICQVFNRWGIEEFGYDYFKTIGFTVSEFDIAVKIFNIRNEQAEREAAEKARQIKLQQIENDRKILDNWIKNGKDTLSVGKNGVTSPRLVFDAGGESVYIEPKKKELSNDSEGERTTRYVVGKFESSPRFEFIVGENNEVTYVDKDLWKSKLDLTEIHFKALAPGSIYLDGLDTTIIVPTRNSYQIIIEYDAIKHVPSTLQGIIIRSKKGKCKFENSIILRNWLNSYYRYNRNEIGFTTDEADTFIEYITNMLCEQLKTEQGKQFKVSFEMIGARKIKHYVNAKEVDSYYQLNCKAILISKEKIK